MQKYYDIVNKNRVKQRSITLDLVFSQIVTLRINYVR